MKILIKESQYRFLVEQQTPQGSRVTNDDFKKAERDRLYNNTQKFVDSTAVTFKGIDGKQKSTATSIKVGKIQPVDMSTYMTILQIGTAFIPVVGPFISAGIGLLSAADLYQKGKKTEAGVQAFFSILPGLGKVVQKIPGIAKLGEKGILALGAKVASNKGLTDVERGIVKSIAGNMTLVKQEVNQTIKTMATNGLSKVNKNPVAKEVVNNAATYGLQYGTNKVATGLSAG
jgi:hypothetical protein